MEEIKRFRVLGHEIFGIIHVPDQKEKKVGVVLLCPGHQYRVGPHRMYVKLARCLENEGYHVLRVDSEGIGDSTGGFSDEYLHEVHGRVQRGKFVKTSRQIIRTFRKEYKLRKIVVSGLCGGSLTGLLSSRWCKDIHGFIGFGLPFFFTDVPDQASGFCSQNRQGSSNSTQPQSSLLQIYLKKAMDISAWKNTFSRGVDWLLLLRVFQQAFQRRILKRDPRIIYRAIAALIALFDSGKQVMLIYSGNDFHYKNFQIAITRHHKLKHTIEEHPDCIAVIEGANHTVSLSEWEKEFQRIFLGWLISLVPHKRSLCINDSGNLHK